MQMSWLCLQQRRHQAGVESQQESEAQQLQLWTAMVEARDDDPGMK